MRTLSLLVALVAVTALQTACPSSQQLGHDDAQQDAGTGDATPPDGPAACVTVVPTCTTTITYHGTGTSVSLRGDFAADGWTAGVPMTATADGFTATIPAGDQQIIVYKFNVDGTWIADPANPRTTPDGYGAANSVVRVDCSHCPARPSIDWRDAVMYFVMVDRFNNGSTANDAPVGSVETPGNYQGGDFVGLRQKIEAGYFNDLGVNTLWITSPLDNSDGANLGADGHNYSGYHGYWPKDLTMPESKLGTQAELKALVDSAHAHGIQVLIDYVMNHVHDSSPVYAAHHDWFWPNDNGAGGNCVCGQGCDWNNQRLRCWFDNFLPDFNFTNPDARRWSVDNAIGWAKSLGIDGFRLDAVKHVETSWLTDLRARIKGEVQWDQRFYMVGETFDGNRDLIKSYVDPDTMLDGQFDFPLRFQILGTILRRDGVMGDLTTLLDSNIGYYGPNAVMSTFLGNHDVPRAIHLAEDTPLWGPFDGGKERAWVNRPTLPTSASPFQRLAVGYTLIYTLPGVPMIYYGDEFGMPGAGDPDNRQFMQWSGYTANQTWLRDRIAALIKVRNSHPALRRGNRTSLGVSTNATVYEMVTPGDTVFVALNRGDGSEAAPGLPPGDYNDLISGGVVHAPLSLAPRSALVLTAK